MATILRYARYLKQSGSLTRRVNISQSNLQSNVVKARLHSDRVLKSASSFGRSGAQRQLPYYGYEKSFQNLETQLRRSGRADRNELEKILSEVQLAGTIPSLEALLLVRCCGRPLIDQSSQDSIQLVKEIWGTMESLKVAIDISHYNALLSVYLEKDHDFSPAEFLQTIIRKQIEPNRVTYHRLIEAYCKKGDIANATKILEKMREANLPLCETVFNSLIIGHSEAGDLKNAVAVLDTMKNAGIEPSVDTYAALLCVYAKRGDMDSINKTITELDSKEIVLLDQHYMKVIETLVVNGHIEKAEIFSMKLMKDIQSDSEVGRLLVKLLDLGHLDLAIAIMKNTTTDLPRFSVRSTMILKAAATSKKITAEQLCNLCALIEDEGWHVRPFAIAMYHLLSKNPDPAIAIPLMKAWKARNAEIREHFFWPLLRAQARQSNFQGIIDVLEVMMKDFNITPSVETLRDYTVPFMFGTLENIIGKLEPLGIPKPVICHAIAHRAVQDKKLRNAAMFMTQYPMNYDADLFLEGMAASLTLFDDTKSFVTILRFLGDEGDEVNVNEVPVKIVDRAVESVLNIAPSYRSNIVESTLNSLLESGLTMSPEMGNRVKLFFDATKAEQMADTIAKLTSGELKPVPLEEFYPVLKDMPNNEYIKRPTGLKIADVRDKFAQNLEQKNSDKLWQILKQLEAIDYQSAPMLAQGLDHFWKEGNLEAAEWCYKEFTKNCKDAQLDPLKILGYASLLIKNNRLEEALQILTDSPDITDNENVSRGIRGRVRNVLEAATECNDPTAVDKVFEFLKSKNFQFFDGFSLGPLVKVHIQNKNIPKAMEVFEKLCVEYKCTPYKNVLATTLIDAEDANALQKLTDLCTEIHGESNALVDLALLFLEAGRPLQAKKILDTSGIQIYNLRIANAIKHFDSINRIDCLELMTKVFRGVTRMDRGHLYDGLLEIFSSKNDWQRGLALWTEMQENDVQPTSYFLSTLGDLLRRNNQRVPFVSEDRTAVTPPRQRQRTIPAIRDDFKDAIAKKNWQAAESMIDLASRGSRETRVYITTLTRALVHAGEVERATELVKKVAKLGIIMPRNTFGQLCDLIIDQGKLDLISDLAASLSEGTKLDLGFYKVQSRLEIAKVGIRNYIEKLKIEDFNDRSTEQKIHFGALAKALLEDPTFVEDFEKWARDLAKTKNIYRGIHVLWNYHFINNSAKAEELWNEDIVNARTPLIRPIINYALEKKDAPLLKKLHMQLKSHPKLDYSVRAKMIGALIEVYNQLGEYGEGLKVLNESTKHFRSTIFRSEAVAELKRGLEASGKTFPYRLSDNDIDTNNEPEERLQGAGKV